MNLLQDLQAASRQQANSTSAVSDSCLVPEIASGTNLGQTDVTASKIATSLKTEEAWKEKKNEVGRFLPQFLHPAAPIPNRPPPHITREDTMHKPRHRQNMSVHWIESWSILSTALAFKFSVSNRVFHTHKLGFHSNTHQVHTPPVPSVLSNSLPTIMTSQIRGTHGIRWAFCRPRRVPNQVVTWGTPRVTSLASPVLLLHRPIFGRVYDLILALYRPCASV